MITTVNLKCVKSKLRKFSICHYILCTHKYHKAHVFGFYGREKFAKGRRNECHNSTTITMNRNWMRRGRMRRKNMMREKNEAKKTPKKITFAAVMFTMNNVKCVRFSVKHEYYSYFLWFYLSWPYFCELIIRLYVVAFVCITLLKLTGTHMYCVFVYGSEKRRKKRRWNSYDKNQHISIEWVSTKMW